MMTVSNTVRRYPRTLYGADGAFPRSAEYGSAITLYPSLWTRILRAFGLR
jgi:hypothetical protein